jgi:RNA polymerase sigma factor (sigma-70 family)
MNGSHHAGALEALLATERPALIAMLSRRIPRRLRGLIGPDDVAQEASLESFRALGTFRPAGDGSLRRWVWRIAARRLQDMVKAQRRLKRAGGAEAEDASRLADVAVDACPVGRIVRSEACESLRRALAALPEPYRRALELRYLHGMAVADVSTRLGRTPGATVMACNRGLGRMRRALIRACGPTPRASIEGVSGSSDPERQSKPRPTSHPTSNGATNMKSRKSATPSTPMEPLENRQLRSATLSGTSLIVNGSPANDVIQVSISYGPLFNVINVYENGAGTGSFIASSVGSIRVYGNAGNDTIAIGSGVMGSYVNGGDGNDYLYGGNGADTLDGWNGDDYVSGGDGNDILYGWYGNDVIVAGNGNDSLHGEYDNDRLFGGNGSDNLFAGSGDDELNGDNDNDNCYGDAGSDTITGGAGADCLYGGDGNDFFSAADGTNDYVDGGAGWDTASVDKKEWWEFWATQDTVVNVENSFEP